jgi:V8-like Glu-specific endopeptidase
MKSWRSSRNSAAKAEGKETPEHLKEPQPIQNDSLIPQEEIESRIESKLLENETSGLETQFIEKNIEEEIPEYKVGKILRQGPWMHPFPLIVGLSITALLIALFAANLQINRLSDELDKTDFFHAPPNLSQLISHVQKSTMVVTCGDSQGSGWVIALGDVIDTADEETKKIDKMYPGSVITNYHVIEDCVGDRLAVTTSNGKKEYEAILFSTDQDNDLAIVSTKLVLPALEISKSPSPGWWSMALGSPFGLEKSISIGNVMNILENQIVSTAPINPGNSGGPLVNSFGEVMGTNTWKLKGADGFNVAKSASLLCDALVDCQDPIWES